MPRKNLKDQKQEQQNLSNYAKYSSIALQMLVIIFFSVFGGMKIDKWLDLNFPVFTVLLSLGGVGFAIYLAIKDFIKMK